MLYKYDKIDDTSSIVTASRSAQILPSYTNTVIEELEPWLVWRITSDWEQWWYYHANLPMLISFRALSDSAVSNLQVNMASPIRAVDAWYSPVTNMIEKIYVTGIGQRATKTGNLVLTIYLLEGSEVLSYADWYFTDSAPYDVSGYSTWQGLDIPITGPKVDTERVTSVAIYNGSTQIYLAGTFHVV